MQGWEGDDGTDRVGEHRTTKLAEEGLGTHCLGGSEWLSIGESVAASLTSLSVGQ